MCVLITSGGGEDLTGGDFGIGASRGGGLGVGILVLKASSQNDFGVEAACGTGAEALKDESDGTKASPSLFSIWQDTGASANLVVDTRPVEASTESADRWP